MTPSPDIQYRAALLQRLIGLRAFLDGSLPLDGVWFGEKHPNKTGTYWWRKHMRAVIDEIAATIPQAVSPQAVQVTDTMAHAARTELIRLGGTLDDGDTMPVPDLIDMRAAIEAALAAQPQAQSPQDKWSDFNREELIDLVERLTDEVTAKPPAQSQACEPVALLPWMKDRAKVVELVEHLESIGWRPDANGDAECHDQAAAMSADVIRKILLPILDSHPPAPSPASAQPAAERHDCELVANGKWKNRQEIELCAASDPEAMGLYLCDNPPAPSPASAASSQRAALVEAGKYCFRACQSSKRRFEEFGKSTKELDSVIATYTAALDAAGRGED